MTTRSVNWLSQCRRGALAPLGAAALLTLSAGPAYSVTFESDDGEIYGSWDTTLSLGTIYRVEKRAADQVGIANGGTAFSVNSDDGDLNFKRNMVSLVAKVTSEIEINYKQFGGFFRGTYFYDHELEKGTRERTPLSQGALNLAGQTGDLLDAFVWWKFDIAGKPAEFRVGEQVVNWGESTFIQGGNNVINHINVAAIRVPGAELREALLPQDLVWFSVAPTDNTELEFVYQYDWDDTEPDPVGTYFGTNDFVPDGGTHVRLGFGDTPDSPNPQFSDQTRPFNAIPRDPTGEPEDGGQGGVALRWFLSDFNNGTELGFYFYNYHSRLPLISARTGSFAGLAAAAAIGAPAGGGGASDIANAAGFSFLVTNPGDRQAALDAGAAAANAGVQDYAARGIADAAISGRDVTFTATAYATDALGATSGYYTSFPEDIKVIGLSFNTTWGLTAWQGEFSHHMDKPYQIDDLEVLFAGLSTLRDQFGEFGQLGSFSYNSTSPQYNVNTPPGTNIVGYRRMDSTQFQATATRLFGPMLGADQGALVWEGAWVHVHKMPSKDKLRFNGPATFVSGNEDLGALAHFGKPVIGPEHFADSNSWGYRFAGRLDYNNLIGSINVFPRFSWQHDVLGITPGPGGNFLEGRKAITLGVAASYQNEWEFDLSYTSFSGAGQYNQLHDRDFVAASVKFTF